MIIGRVMDMLADYRRSHEGRFQHQRDEWRLTVLSGILLTFCMLEFVDALRSTFFWGQELGSFAMFSGVAIVYFALKIGRGQIYFDWVAAGALYAGAGVALSRFEMLRDTPSLLVFCAVLIASGMVRAWIALTASPHEGAAWIYYSGWFGVLGGGSVFAGWALETPIPPLIVLAFDSLFQGISIAGYGLALRGAEKRL